MSVLVRHRPIGIVVRQHFRVYLVAEIVTMMGSAREI